MKTLSALAILFASALVALPAAAAAPDWSKAKLLTVTTTEYAFKPSALVLHRGTAYRLHLVNAGKEMHEFSAPALFQASTIRNPEALAEEGKELDVQPHQTSDLYFVPEKAGKYPLTCPDHDWEGMTGSITVK